MMNILSAIISGIVGTIGISIVMAVAPMMGMSKMDIVGLLSTLFGKPNRVLGWMMHMMMGVVFALIYAFLWSLGIGSPNWLFGLIFGAVHWLIVDGFPGRIIGAYGLWFGGCPDLQSNLINIPSIDLGVSCYCWNRPLLYWIRNNYDTSTPQ
jgi:hypothetical protein